MRLSRIRIIKQIEEGVIYRGRRQRWITPSEICLILHILRKPNSLIALLFVQNNSQLKNIAETCLPASMLSSSSILYFQVCPALQIFSKQQMSLFALSSCCFCHVFSYHFAMSAVCNVRHFCFQTQNNSTSSPGLLG